MDQHRGPGPEMQTTIRHSMSVAGTGLHSNAPVRMDVSPGDAYTGIVLIRSDLPGSAPIPAQLSNVHSTALATCIGVGDHRVSTVEHLLSACAGLGVDNLRVEVNGPELPALDGSAAGFVELLRAAGKQEQSAPCLWARVCAPVEVRNDDDAWCRLEPASKFRVSYELDYPQPVFQQYPRTGDVDVTPASYRNEVASARTFCTMGDYQAMQRRNLGRGGSLDNAVLVDDCAVLNPGGLRFPDEFVKHKILDAIGDLRLLGGRILGHFTGHKSGHTLNIRLLRQLLEIPGALEYCENLTGVPAYRPTSVAANSSEAGTLAPGSAA